MVRKHFVKKIIMAAALLTLSLAFGGLTGAVAEESETVEETLAAECDITEDDIEGTADFAGTTEITIDFENIVDIEDVTLTEDFTETMQSKGDENPEEINPETYNDSLIIDGDAAAGGVIASGNCGDPTWTLYDDGTLVISGTGRVFTQYYNPWIEEGYSDKILSLKLEEGISKIDMYSFYGCINLKYVDLPESITYIGPMAFSGCRALPEIVIPKEANIDAETFKDCSSLKNIVIPEGMSILPSGAFSDCTSLSDVTLPKTLTTIKFGAFSGCTALTGITLPEGVTELMNGAFYGCTGLKHITIPKSLTTIGVNVFEGCSSLTDIYYNGTPESWAKLEDSVGGIERSVNSVIHYAGEEMPITLPAVSGLNATPTGMNTVTLTWNKSEGADGYLILRGGKQIGYSMTNSYVDSSANANDFNYYWVIPFAKQNGKTVKGQLSNYVWALGRIVGQVQKVTAQAGKSGIKLSWNAVDGANGYVILSKTGSSKAAFNAPVKTAETSYTDMSAASGVTQFYWVYAVYNNAAGQTQAAGKVSPFAWAVGK